MKKIALVGGLSLVVSLSAATLCENGKSDYAIVVGVEAQDKVAASEIQEIVARSTGVSLPIESGSEVEKAGGGGQRRGKFIYVGYTAEAEKAFGKDDLKENEYAVTEKKPTLGLFGGGDIWIRGNGNRATLLAAYAFLEDVFGFRHFMPEDGGERIVRQSTVKTDGLNIRRTAAFPFKRELTHTFLYGNKANLCPFIYRNGSHLNHAWNAKTKYFDLIEPYPLKDTGHGFFLYIPCKREGMDLGKGAYEWDENIDFFAIHPEWFSMDANGKRTDRLQLCFSNKELRKAFTKRVLERCRRVDGVGFLGIGANDVPGPFCHCPDCKALQKKYDTPAGAYWDYLPELCNAVAEKYPKVFIETLAYRKEQSENFPNGVERFPDNFVVDFAPVDDNQAFVIGGKGNEKSLDNMRKWAKACKMVDYWHYACTPHPFGPVARAAGCLRAEHVAGVDGTKLCGLYAPGLGCLLDYLYLRLALDPSRDEWQIVKEFCDFAYGAAADDVIALIRELDRIWEETDCFVDIDMDATFLKIYKAKDLVRWQRMLDAAEKKLGDDPYVRRNFSWVRWDIDMLTLQFWRNVRDEKDRPADLNPETVYNRMTEVEHMARYRSKKATKGQEATGLHAKARNAYLIAKALDKPIPEPLASLAKDPNVAVYRLPQCGGFHGIKDPDASCGEAKSELFPTNLKYSVYQDRKVWFVYYDCDNKRSVKEVKLDLSKAKPGEYHLYHLCTEKIVPGGLLTFASWWGIGQSIANYYPEGDAERKFEMWASLKLIGPQFGIPTPDGRNRMLCDCIYLVDKNGRKYKGE